MARIRKSQPLARKNGTYRPRQLSAFVSLESLEDRTMLSAVTVDNNLDVVNGDTSSIAALLASDGGDGISLREAVLATNNTSGADTIDFDASLSGSTITLGGTHIWISDDVTITGLGADLLTIDADNMSRVFLIRDSSPSMAVVNISGVTLTRGYEGGVTDAGGAILNQEHLTISDSVIIGNFAADGGGGVENVRSSTGFSDTAWLRIINSTIVGNSTAGNGGAIRSGHGSSVNTSVWVVNSTISDNTASDGGGISFGSGSLHILNSAIFDNSATNKGGGIHGRSSGSHAFVTNSTVSSNTAGGQGGGIYTFGADYFRNSTISGNSATGDGGGVFVGTDANSAATFWSTLVSGNSATGGGDEIYKHAGTIVADANNLFGHSGLTNADAFYNFTPGTADITATSDGTDPTILTDILDTALADNGGPTFTHALVVGSPAIDEGTNGYLLSDSWDLDGDGNTSEPIPVDQRGMPFLREYGTIDIGAFEWQPLIINGTTGDDDITISLGALFEVTVNGVDYEYDPALFNNSIEVHGLAGNDRLHIIGTSGVEDTTMSPGTVQVVGSVSSVTGDGFEDIEVTSGGGEDRAFMYDSVGDDHFDATPTVATLQGTGYVLKVNNYRRAYAYSYAGGFDTAELHGSAGLDNFNGEDIRSTLSSTNYYNSATRFEQVDAYANTPDDSATMWDSTGVDIYTVTPGLSSLTGTGFNNRANSFNRVYAYSYASGVDEAHFYDSSADDFFVGKDVRSTIQNPDVTFYGSATRFEKVYAYAVNGGTDRADMYGNANSDTLISGVDQTTMFASDYFYQVNNFETNNAWAGAGGTDTANFTDSTGNDWFLDIPTSSYVVWENNNRISSFNFNTVEFESLFGGSDYAEFRSLGTLDEVYGLDDLVEVTRSNGRVISATGIDEVIAESLAAPGPVLDLTSIDYTFTQTGTW